VGASVPKPIRLRLESTVQRRGTPCGSATGEAKLLQASYFMCSQVSASAADATQWAAQVCCCCCARATVARYAAAGPAAHSAARTLPGSMRPLPREPQFITLSPPARF